MIKLSYGLPTLETNIEYSLLNFQAGEESNFNYYFRLYFKPLTHFAFSIVGKKEIAEDVVEDAFMNLWERRERINSESAIKPYLYASVRNGCISILRKEKNANAYESHAKKLPFPIAESIIQKIILSEAMNHVYLAVEKLPFKYKKIFHMLWVQGKEIKDIAKELNLPISTVKSQKARTLELIRKQLPHLGSVVLLIFYWAF